MQLSSIIHSTLHASEWFAREVYAHDTFLQLIAPVFYSLEGVISLYKKTSSHKLCLETFPGIYFWLSLPMNSKCPSVNIYILLGIIHFTSFSSHPNCHLLLL